TAASAAPSPAWTNCTVTVRTGSAVWAVAIAGAVVLVGVGDTLDGATAPASIPPAATCSAAGGVPGGAAANSASLEAATEPGGTDGSATAVGSSPAVLQVVSITPATLDGTTVFAREAGSDAARSVAATSAAAVVFA